MDLKLCYQAHPKLFLLVCRCLRGSIVCAGFSFHQGTMQKPISPHYSHGFCLRSKKAKLDHSMPCASPAAGITCGGDGSHVDCVHHATFRPHFLEQACVPSFNILQKDTLT